MPSLKDKYLKEVAPALKEKFKYTSAMQIPKLEKIVLNMGVGDVKENAKALDAAANDRTKAYYNKGEKVGSCF
jgi:large subunit ribosomal protein L5